MSNVLAADASMVSVVSTTSTIPAGFDGGTGHVGFNNPPSGATTAYNVYKVHSAQLNALGASDIECTVAVLTPASPAGCVVLWSGGNGSKFLCTTGGGSATTPGASTLSGQLAQLGWQVIIPAWVNSSGAANPWALAPVQPPQRIGPVRMACRVAAMWQYIRANLVATAAATNIVLGGLSQGSAVVAMLLGNYGLRQGVKRALFMSGPAYTRLSRALSLLPADVAAGMAATFNNRVLFDVVVGWQDAGTPGGANGPFFTLATDYNSELSEWGSDTGCDWSWAGSGPGQIPCAFIRGAQDNSPVMLTEGPISGSGTSWTVPVTVPAIAGPSSTYDIAAGDVIYMENAEGEVNSFTSASNLHASTGGTQTLALTGSVTATNGFPTGSQCCDTSVDATGIPVHMEDWAVTKSAPALWTPRQNADGTPGFSYKVVEGSAHDFDQQTNGIGAISRAIGQPTLGPLPDVADFTDSGLLAQTSITAGLRFPVMPGAGVFAATTSVGAPTTVTAPTGFSAVTNAEIGTTGHYLTLWARQRLDTATVASGSATVADTHIQTGDQGKPVFGPGIPPGTYVGTVTPGTSFLLSSSPTSQVDVTATANGADLIVVYPLTAADDRLSTTWGFTTAGDVILFTVGCAGLRNPTVEATASLGSTSAGTSSSLAAADWNATFTGQTLPSSLQQLYIVATAAAAGQTAWGSPGNGRSVYTAVPGGGMQLTAVNPATTASNPTFTSTWTGSAAWAMAAIRLKGN